MHKPDDLVIPTHLERRVIPIHISVDTVERRSFAEPMRRRQAYQLWAPERLVPELFELLDLALRG